MKFISGKGRNVKGRVKSEKINTEKIKTEKIKRDKIRGKIGGKIALVVILVFLIGITASTIAFGLFVRDLETVFPNVWAEGVNLSGLTFEEARRLLINEGYESNAEGVAATIVFSDGGSFTIYGNDVGFALNADEAAAAAFEFGRGGGFPQAELAFIRAYFGTTELRNLSMSRFDEQHVRRLVSENTERFNKTLIDDAYTINSDSIVIVKGAGIEPANEDEVFALAVETLHRALEARTHLTAEVITNSIGMVDIDLSALYDRVSVEPMSAKYDPETFSVTESVAGVSFDMDAAQSKINNAANGSEIIIPLIQLEPEISAEEIESLLFRDTISTSTTTISGTAARLNNIVLASEEVHGTMLNPGDLFCFNQIVGRRTTARGFREAGAFSGGRMVDVIGGGICQVTSTIYDALLRTTLEVVSRRNHGLTVGYLPLGHDAAISYGQIEFRFRNNTDYPLRVETIVDGRRLTVNLIGTKLDDTTIEVRTNRVSTTAFETVMQEDENVSAGQTVVETPGSNGHVVEVFQRFLDADGKLIEEKRVSRDTYNTQDRLILVPIGALEDEPGATTPPNETPSSSPPPSDPPPNETPPSESPPSEPPPSESPPSDPPPSEPPSSEPPSNEPPPSNDSPPSEPPQNESTDE